MSMIEESMTEVVMMEKHGTSDGEGGYIMQWAEGVHFRAAITFDASMQARIADKQGVTSLYTITTVKNAPLQYYDILKRLKDGKIFRVTSDGDDKQTPARAMFGQYLQVTAEEWQLT